MNPLYFISKKLHAAWLEANRPLFPDSAGDDHFYAELFNYYQSRKSSFIDISSGESLFPVTTGSTGSINSINKTRQVQRQNLSEASALTGFLARDLKTA